MENFHLLRAVPRGKEYGRKKGKGEDIGKVKTRLKMMKKQSGSNRKIEKKKMRKWKGEEEDWISRPVFPDLAT